MYDLSDLTNELHKKGIEIAIETSGAYKIKGDFDWICLSPKKFKLPLEENYSKANELKMIIFNHHDFSWAATLKQKVTTDCKLYLQPEWDKAEKMLPLIIDYVKNNTEWKISLQTHKYLNIP
jgi:organic radical activating enzyme